MPADQRFALIDRSGKSNPSLFRAPMFRIGLHCLGGQRMNRRLVWILLALLIAAPAWAQQGTTELRGRVEDAQKGALPGVTVTVRNQATGMYRETVTGGDGSFIASGLTPGTYE